MNSFKSKILIFAIIFVPITISLGLWQIQRAEEKNIIIADPEIAPAGSYSKQVLENIFHVRDIDNKIISTGDVSYVSSMLVSNDKYYGILYKTEAIKNNLFIIHEFPNTFHDDIEYKTGVLSQNNNTYINNFIDRLNSPTVKKKLSELGFEIQK